ncbi:MAG: NAD(P)-binding protein, partial [Stellaceae bacterium]
MAGKPLRIAVIGAGIGGLTAALSLHQSGFAVDAYEQSP